MIADEWVVVGLDFGIDIDTTFEFEWKPGHMCASQRVHLGLEGA